MLYPDQATLYLILMGNIVRGGTVIDGTGAPPRSVDIKLEKGKIVKIGDIKKGGKEIEKIQFNPR